MITNDFRGHRVCRFVVTPEGAGYTSKEQPELIKTSHPAFRPIDVKMGPDGAIYIADWYNPIIQHGEVDFRDPRRDVSHGRIWRVTAKGRPLVPRPQLIGAKTEDLLEALKAPEDWTRHNARRVLKERGKVVLPVLAEWVKHLDPANPADEPARLDALWTYQSLDVVEPKLLAALLRAADGRVRAAATRVLGAWHARVNNALDLLAVQVADEHPQVRLEAVRALGQVRSVRAAELALVAVDRPVDKWIDYGLWLTCRELEPQWLPAFQQGKLDFGGKTPRLLFALRAVASPAIIRPLVELVRAGKVDANDEGVLTLIATFGNAQELTTILDRLLAGEAVPVKLRMQLLAGLEQAARQRNVRPAGDLNRLAMLLKSDSEELRVAAVRLTGQWKVEGVRPHFVELTRAASTSETLRQAAFDGLVALGGPASKEALAGLTRDDKVPVARRRQALIALAGLDLETAAPEVVAVLALAPEGAGAAELFQAFLQRQNGVAVLATALAGKKLPSDVAKIGVRTIRTTAREAPALVEALTKAGGLTFGVRKLSKEEMQQMVADVVGKGDPARGETVYRRPDLSCLKCHAIGGAGGLVGPDLSSIGGSAQVDYLVESLLEPNKAVKEGYHAMLITTKKGQLLTGIKVRQTPTELLLRNAEDKEIAVPLKDIDEQSMGGSLMPDGLTDTLTRGEFVDLVRFLSELGKVGPYAVSKARVVRRWQVLEATPAAKPILERAGLDAVLRDDPHLLWGPGYSTVAGTLPIAELPRVAVPLPTGRMLKPLSVVRCQVEVTTAGPIVLRLNVGKNGVLDQAVFLWQNRNKVEVKDTLTLQLPVGMHTLTLALDPARAGAELRCEIDEQAGSPARVRIVAGK
jgi:putative heme-binding domain-containing protein